MTSRLVQVVGVACFILLLGRPIRSESPANVKPTPTDHYGDPLPPGAIARLGTVRLRDPGGAMAVVFSPDGKMLASGGRDSLVRLWDASTGKEIHRLKGHRTWVQALAFSPDGKILASGTSHNDRLLLLWDTASGKRIRSFPGSLNGTTGLAFAPDGKNLASSGEDGTILVRETASGKEVLRIQAHPDRAMTVAYSPDGRWLASGGARDPQPVARLWDAATGKEVRQFRGHEQGICGVAFSPDGKMLASASFDATVRLWEVGTGKVVHRLKLEGIGRTVAFAPSGQLLAGKSWNGPIHMWDALTGEEIRQLPKSSDGSSVAFAPDGTIVAGGGRSVHLWEVVNGKPRLLSGGHEGGVDAVGFTSDGKFAISLSSDGTLRAWDPIAGQERRRVEGLKRIYSKTAFGPTGRPLPRRAEESLSLLDAAANKALLRVRMPGSDYVAGLAADTKELASRCADKAVPVFDASTGEELRRLGVEQGSEKIASSPDGKILATKEVGFTLRLREVASGKELRRLSVGAGPGFVIAFAPNSKMLAAPGIGTLDLLEVASGKPLHKLRLPVPSPFFGQTAFAPGSRVLASRSGGGGLALWDVLTGKVMGQLIGRENDVLAFAFSPDGRTLALAVQDHTIRLWDAFTGQEIRRFLGHEAIAGSLAFAPDGRRLVSGSWDCTALVWDVTGGVSPKTPDGKELQTLWDDLDGTDAVRADRAFWTLAAAPSQAVALLRERLTSGRHTKKLDLTRLLADLDDERFAVREKAEQQLAQLGERVESALRRELEKKPALEARRRIERLLVRLERKLGGVSPLAVRTLRAVRILEQIGTPEAGAVLEDLAFGAKDLALAAEAGAALDRRTRRK